MKTIVAAVDFSAATEPVLREAVRVCRLLKARLAVVHVVPPPSTLRDLFPAGALSAELLLAAKREASERLEQIARAVGRKVRRVEILRVTGEPVGAIVAEAARLKAEFLLIGAHGHTAIFDRLTGGVARGVLARAECPVIVVPAARSRRA